MSPHSIHFQNKIRALELSQKFSFLLLWQKNLGLENEIELAVVNEPSVFEPLKFYCILDHAALLTRFCNRKRAVGRASTIGFRSITPKPFEIFE